MVLMLRGAFALLLSSLAAVSSFKLGRKNHSSRVPTEHCTYHCDAEMCPTSKYYYFNESNGNCTRAPGLIDVSKYLLGGASCGGLLWLSSRNTIHDETTCREFEKFAERESGVLWRRPSDYFGVVFEWSPQFGCRLRGYADFWGMPQAITVVCLDDAQAWERILPPIVGGMLIGLVLAWISVKGCSTGPRDIVNDRVLGDSTKSEDFKEFWPGSKLLVASANVKASCNRQWVLVYRVLQVIANAWFPMVVVIFVNLHISITLYMLYYVIPAFLCAGFDLFRQPIYLLAPPDCSLFGLDLGQVDQSSHYLWSAIRPYIHLASVYIWGLTYTLATPEKFQEEWFWNGSGFFRASLLEDPAPFCMDFVFWGSMLGVIGHTLMTLQLFYYSLRPSTHKAVYITMRPNEHLVQSVRHQSERLCDEVSKVTCQWEDQFDAEDEDEWRENLFRSTLTTTSGRIIEVDPEAPLGLVMAICLAAIDFLCYLYKIAVFLQGSSFYLATIIAVALSEALFHLILTGAFWNLRNTVQRTFRARVQTTDFISWIHWDDGLAGVPYLMVTTIYAFPLQNLNTWLYVILAIIFTCTGTKAMAQFIMQCVDYDMVDVDEDDSALRTLEKVVHRDESILDLLESTVGTYDMEDSYSSSEELHSM